MRNTAAEADQDDGASLYDLIVDACGIEYDPGKFPDVEDYKNQLVRYFGRMDADAFDKLPNDVRDWANDASTIFNNNKRAKDDRSPLPDIDGLPEEDEPAPPPPARRARVAVDDDDDDEAPPPPTRTRTRRVVAAPPPDDDDDDEPEPAPPPRTRARRTPAAAPTPAPAPAVRRDPDSGRYAKVMPHYLKDRDIDVPGLQVKIEKTDGASYSETTLDRTLAACQAVVGWLERNGVNLDRLSR